MEYSDQNVEKIVRNYYELKIDILNSVTLPFERERNQSYIGAKQRLSELKTITNLVLQHNLRLPSLEEQLQNLEKELEHLL